MKTSDYFILALLALAITNVTSKTVHEPTKPKFHSRSRLDGLMSLHAESPNANPAELNELIGLANYHVDDLNNNCVTAEMCKKKKVICYRKCPDSPGSDVGKNHLPGNRCTVKCKKCVPTC
ncbi:uncharacterized protein A4U43_C07F21420 [Asparagus officinalis]|uniref:Uncharacterized protein n=1 Tax=Asparagus officinalis TaxID=4686 RepID=A0A5P1EDX9_ASPOF|nr:uncharacterized protein A4U43_C07F21420 [Asparagus officinalis]